MWWSGVGQSWEEHPPPWSGGKIHPLGLGETLGWGKFHPLGLGEVPPPGSGKFHPLGLGRSSPWSGGSLPLQKKDRLGSNARVSRLLLRELGARTIGTLNTTKLLSTPVSSTCTANLRTKILDFRGFDSSRILILRGGILISIGNFPESLSRRETGTTLPC